MAHLHAAKRYDRSKHDVEPITGRPLTSVREFVARHMPSDSGQRARPRRLRREAEPMWIERKEDALGTLAIINTQLTMSGAVIRDAT